MIPMITTRTLTTISMKLSVKMIKTIVMITIVIIMVKNVIDIRIKLIIMHNCANE